MSPKKPPKPPPKQRSPKSSSSSLSDLSLSGPPPSRVPLLKTPLIVQASNPQTPKAPTLKISPPKPPPSSSAPSFSPWARKLIVALTIYPRPSLTYAQISAVLSNFYTDSAPYYQDLCEEIKGSQPGLWHEQYTRDMRKEEGYWKGAARRVARDWRRKEERERAEEEEDPSFTPGVREKVGKTSAEAKRSLARPMEEKCGVVEESLDCSSGGGEEKGRVFEENLKDLMEDEARRARSSGEEGAGL